MKQPQSNPRHLSQDKVNIVLSNRLSEITDAIYLYINFLCSLWNGWFSLILIAPSKDKSESDIKYFIKEILNRVIIIKIKASTYVTKENS